MASSRKLKAVVLDGHTLNPGDLSWAALEEIVELQVHDRTPPGQVVERAADAAILISNKTPLDAGQIARLPDLRFITMLATGYNVIDTGAAAKRGIPVSNVPTYGTDMVAQHTIALLLELCNRCGEHAVAVREGEWERSPDFCFWKSPLLELSGKVLGVAGYGRIGRRVAAIAEALGMTVQYFSRHAKAQDGDAGRFVGWEELLKTSDVVSLHCALTPETRQMINRETLAQMKPTAFLLNTSRGGLIDEAALAEALRERVIAGAGLDVLSEEPPRGNPLTGAPHCVITPHIAWTGIEARKRLMAVTVANVRAFLNGAPTNVVNGVQP